MNDTSKDVYADYFTNRKALGVDTGSYRVPAYLEPVLPLDREATILDIGCGCGTLLADLRSRGYRSLRGIDRSDEAVRACTEAGLDVIKIGSISEFCRAEPPRQDLVIMSHVLEHIEKDAIVGTLRAIREHLLVPGGKLIVVTPNAQSATGCYWAYEDFTHTTIFTAGSLYFVLKCAGFQQVEFFDPLGLAGSSFPVRLIKRALIPLFKAKAVFWNLVTSSSFHRASPQIFSFELKAIAR